MTTVNHIDQDGNDMAVSEVYEIPEKASLFEAMSQKEKRLSGMVERQGGTIVSIKSELISRRRYKRRRAKAKLAKKARKANR